MTSFRSTLTRLVLAGVLPGLLSACAELQPKPLAFQLTQAGALFNGFFYPAERRMEVLIGERHYSGFYIQSTSTAVSQGMWPRNRLTPYPGDMVATTISNNSARAVMNAGDGERLFCDFIFEGPRALGECKSESGESFRLMTQARQ